jgi:hypothetical protein
VEQASSLFVLAIKQAGCLFHCVIKQAGCLFHGYSDRANTNLTNYYTPYMEASPSNSFQKLVKLSQTYADKGF